MRHRAKGRQLSRTSSHRRALLQQHGDQPVPARPDRHHRGQGQGAAAVRREADHPGAPGRPARPPAGRAAGSRSASAVARSSARSALASPRGPAATPASSSWATAPATARTSPGSSCSPSEAGARGSRKRRKGTLGSPFFRSAASPARQTGGGRAQAAFLIRLLLRHCVHTRTRAGRAVHQDAHGLEIRDTSGAWSGCWRG